MCKWNWPSAWPSLSSWLSWEFYHRPIIKTFPVQPAESNNSQIEEENCLSKRARSKQRNDERLFFYVATIVSSGFGTGFCLLMIALHSRENETSGAVENSPSRLISPGHR